jgi:hypothetical protein
MNKRDAMVISKNEFKFTDEEAKVFNNNIEKAVAATVLNMPTELEEGSEFSGVSGQIIGDKFLLTLVTLTKGKDSVDIETKSVSQEDYFKFLGQ